MSEDSYSETTSESWLSRLGSAIVGVLIGVVLFIASFVVLFWNEGRAVTTAQRLAEGKGLVVSVAADKVDPANEGKLVHITAEAITKDTLTDPDFGVSVTAIRLRRNAEMYSWKEEKKSEKKKKLGGGEETVTTYTYKETWASNPEDSSGFKIQEGHMNPPMTLKGETQEAKTVTVGAFQLPPSLVKKITKEEKLPASDSDAGKPAKLPEGFKVSSGYFFKGDPTTPAIGDLRVEFFAVKPLTVSLIARQVKSTFEPYPAQAGGTIEMLKEGTASAQAMFEQAEAENVMMTWILRLVGFIAMAAGIFLFFKPLVVLADVIPIVGDLLGAGIGIFAVLVALPLSVITIAIGWVFYRPVLGIALLAGAVVILVGAIMWAKKAKAKKAVA